MLENNYLDSSEFTKDQKQEIELGILAGVDVSVYARPEFLAIQMYQIRTGLEDNLPVKYYAKPEYDWFQMDEIKLGLESGVDVKKYASADIPFDVMRQIRLGLEDGIDLSAEKNMAAGVLRQLRIATINGVDITKYVKLGYDEEQLKNIRIALEKKIDIGPYIDVSMCGAIIREITLGLEQNLDVSQYTADDFSWQQMREIRLGLEKRLDVNNYKKKLYSWQQMREIRLGLEENLDITYYKSMMYTSSEMVKRRQHLLKSSRHTHADTKSSYNNFMIMTSSDGMKANMLVIDKGIKIPKEQILSALKENNVTMGIDYNMIDEIAVNGAPAEVITIAVGKKPKSGKDGWYEFLFDTNFKSKPVLLENGSVDYRNIKCFEAVKKDQPVAYYHKAIIGEEGYNVHGGIVPGVKGKEIPAIKGTGFKILSDSITYVAAIDGKVELNGGHLEITSLLVLDSLTIASGDVNFNGSVYVRGTIGNDVRIKATGDIIVDEFTESAVIEAKGDIILREGNNAGGKGYIKAGRDVMGKFFENANIYAGRNVKANYCLNSNISAEEEVQIAGLRGSLAGGVIHAGTCVTSQYIGNMVGKVTYIQVGCQEKFENQMAALNKQEDGINNELTLLRNAYTDMQRKFPPELRNNNPMYIKIESAIYTKELELKEINKNREIHKADAVKNKAAKVVITGTIYPGVKVNINGATWNAKQTSSITLKKKDSNIAFYRNI